MGTRNFGFSSQHRLESSFLIEWSQTCYIFELAPALAEETARRRQIFVSIRVHSWFASPP